MFRSLHMKLVIILILLIVSVMAIMGTFLVNSVGSYYLNDFETQIENVMTENNYETYRSLEQAAQENDAPERIMEILSAFVGRLGIDSYRTYAVLDGNGTFLTGDNGALASELTRTPNILTAIGGEVGAANTTIDSYMDYAIPLGKDDDGEPKYIVYFFDDKRETRDLSWNFFGIVVKAMTFGLLVAVLLSFLLSKTITTPIENIRTRAQMVAAGDFSHRLDIQSNDEIGELTATFNHMADRLHDTLEEIQGERDKLGTIFLHMTDGVTAFNAEGKLIHMNPTAENLLGATFQEDAHFNDVFEGIDAPTPIAAGEQGFVQMELERMGRTLSVLFAPYGENERGIIAVIHDITEQRKLDEARREFIANVSHELRTPLTNVKSYTETLIDAAGELPTDTEVKFLSVIAGETDRMTRIVKDLLTLSKLDCGKMDLHFHRFSMQHMVESVYNAMVLEAGNNGLELTLNIQGKMPDMNGDRERLEQVVINILSNAVKYTPSGGHIVLSAARRDEGHVMIRVKDDGMGIPKDDIPRLFERFYRVDKARSRAKGGSGLGLAIAKEMVEAHRGTIYLESQLDEGTTVTVVLPTNLPADQDGMV
ncbi:MAG TPA: cell wall metabolism sensor histidine kinase WalK [Butyricicoccus pullicaecorum]|nr:cell wall metabolism sensor histidine kinase WalK [Butyricicoccus pullicaecorum]